MKLPSFVILASLCCFASISKAYTDTSHLPENASLVKAGGKFVTLLGHQVSVGEKAPDFTVVNESFSKVQLSDFANKTILISAVPSLDTGVCSLQTKRFNEEVSNYSDDIVMLTISNDLPFAQKRFCQAENIDQVTVLSDSVWRDFSTQYGLLIKDMGLITRAIIIIDKAGKLAYKEIVETISEHPNYDLALSTLKTIDTNESVEPVEMKN